MNFMLTQGIIATTIILGGILKGKKGAIVTGAIWLIATFFVLKNNLVSIFQLLTVVMAYQISLIIGIVSDYIKKKKLKAKSE